MKEKLVEIYLDQLRLAGYKMKKYQPITKKSSKHKKDKHNEAMRAF